MVVASSMTTSDSPGKPASSSLSSPSALAGSAVASMRRRSALGPTTCLASWTAAASTSSWRGLEGLDLLGDQTGLLAVLVVDLAADHDDRVSGQRVL